MKRVKALGLICCFLLLGWANIAVAADGDTYSAMSTFETGQSIKAKDSPFLGVALDIPPDIVEGVEFTANCVFEALKRVGVGRSKVKGTLAPFFIGLDVGTGTWSFDGLSSSGIEWKTKKDGTADIVIGPVTAGAWANEVNKANDFLSFQIQINKGRGVKQTSLMCSITVGA
jgi:hypothetical protein